MKHSKTCLICTIALFASALSGCSSNGVFSGGEGSFWGNSSYERYGEDNDRPKRSYRPVVVKPGYHMEGRNSPITHKARDTHWIDQQAPEDFTIEVATDQKASTVAKALHKSPKTQRAAQYKFKQGEKTYFGGAYGSYKTKEDAEKAMANLPEDVRANAKIKTWNSIQPTVEKAPTKAPSSKPGLTQAAPSDPPMQ